MQNRSGASDFQLCLCRNYYVPLPLVTQPCKKHPTRFFMEPPRVTVDFVHFIRFKLSLSSSLFKKCAFFTEREKKTFLLKFFFRARGLSSKEASRRETSPLEGNPTCEARARKNYLRFLMTRVFKFTLASLCAG